MLIEWCCLLCGVVHLIDDEAESSIADLLPQVFARYFASRKVAPSQNEDYSTDPFSNDSRHSLPVPSNQVQLRQDRRGEEPRAPWRRNEL